MSSTPNRGEIIQECLGAALLAEARRDETGNVLDAALRCADRLGGYLETIIGSAGARALYQRSLTLTRREHPWLLAALPAAPAPIRPVVVTAALPEDPAATQRGALGLLLSFSGLLIGFLGERLTVQALVNVWPEMEPMLRHKKESS